MKRSITLPLDDPRHGTLHAYRVLKCGCDDCKAAHARYMRTWTNGDPKRIERHKAAQRRYRARISQGLGCD